MTAKEIIDALDGLNNIPVTFKYAQRVRQYDTITDGDDLEFGRIESVSRFDGEHRENSVTIFVRKKEEEDYVKEDIEKEGIL